MPKGVVTVLILKSLYKGSFRRVAEKDDILCAKTSAVIFG